MMASLTLRAIMKNMDTISVQFSEGESDEFIRIGKAFGESLKYGRVTNLFSTIK